MLPMQIMQIMHNIKLMKTKKSKKNIFYEHTNFLVSIIDLRKRIIIYF